MSDHPERPEDLTANPMAGYRPAVSKQHCKTMMMPAFIPEQHQKVQSTMALAPTEEMKAVDSILTVRDVIREILEVDMEAWKKLPYTIQDLMLSKPEQFKLHKFSNTGMNLVPDIIYNNVRIRFNDELRVWQLYGLEIV